MKIIIDKIKKALVPLFNTRAAGVYFLLFAGAIAVATFIENDYGTSAAIEDEVDEDEEGEEGAEGEEGTTEETAQE